MLHASIVEKTMGTPMPNRAEKAPAPRMGLRTWATIAALSSTLGAFILVLGVLGILPDSVVWPGSLIFSILGTTLSILSLIAGFVVGQEYSRESLGRVAILLPVPHVLGLPVFLFLAFGSGFAGNKGLEDFCGFLFYASLALIFVTGFGGSWVKSLGTTTIVHLCKKP
jgi:uncharacterized RDD family membrane protein YckC